MKSKRDAKKQPMGLGRGLSASQTGMKVHVYHARALAHSVMNEKRNIFQPKMGSRTMVR